MKKEKTFKPIIIQSPYEHGEYMIDKDIVDRQVNGKWKSVDVFAVYFRKHGLEDYESVMGMPTLGEARLWVENEIAKACTKKLGGFVIPETTVTSKAFKCATQEMAGILRRAGLSDKEAKQNAKTGIMTVLNALGVRTREIEIEAED